MRVTVETCKRPASDEATHKYYAEVYPASSEAAPDPDQPIHTTGFWRNRTAAAAQAGHWSESHGHTVQRATA